MTGGKVRREQSAVWLFALAAVLSVAGCGKGTAGDRAQEAEKHPEFREGFDVLDRCEDAAKEKFPDVDWTSNAVFVIDNPRRPGQRDYMHVATKPRDLYCIVRGTDEKQWAVEEVTTKRPTWLRE